MTMKEGKMEMEMEMVTRLENKLDNIIDSLTEDKVGQSFNKIIGLLRKESRKLNDDDSYDLSTKLKAWFNKNVL